MVELLQGEYTTLTDCPVFLGNSRPIERIEFVAAARVVPQWRNLPHLKGIRELSFYQCLLNQEDINALASLPGVRELQLLDLRHNEGLLMNARWDPTARRRVVPAIDRLRELITSGQFPKNTLNEFL